MPYQGLAAGAGILGGLTSLGSLGSRHDAYREQVKMRHSALAMYGRGMMQNRAGMDTAEKGLKGVVQGLNKGFGQARADLSQFGNSARRGVLTNQAQGMAQMTQRLQSAGLANSTVMANAQAGMAARTSRELADVDERLGALFANLRTAQTGAVAGAQTNLSQFQAGRAQSDFANRTGYINLYLGSAAQKPDPWAAIGAGLNTMSAGLGGLK